MIIPEVINNYNVYDSKAKMLIGISGEVELPSLEAITDTIEAAGILGEVSSMKIKIPFSNLYTDQFNLMDTTNPPQLTLRGSMQVMNSATGGTDYVPVKIVTRGKSTTSSMGKLSKGKKGEPEIEMEVLYLKVMINNKITLELDKLNFKYVLNGKDMLAKIRSQC